MALNTWRLKVILILHSSSWWEPPNFIFTEAVKNTGAYTIFSLFLHIWTIISFPRFQIRLNWFQYFRTFWHAVILLCFSVCFITVARMFTCSVIQSFIIAMNHELWVTSFKEDPVKFQKQTREKQNYCFLPYLSSNLARTRAFAVLQCSCKSILSGGFQKENDCDNRSVLRLSRVFVDLQGLSF